MSDAEIARLREAVAAVDRDLVALVARRLLLVEAIGLEKRIAGVPIRHADVEEQVVERLRRECEARGIRKDVATALGSLLIEESVRRQEAVLAPDLLGRKAAIIGGSGRMGRWLARFLRSRGYDIVIVDPAPSPEGFPREADLAKAIGDADVLAVATPVSATDAVLRRIASLRPAALIFDLASLKSPFRETLRGMASAGLRVASVHPLFGPTLWPPSRGTILVCDCGDADAAAEAKALFRDTGASLMEVPLDDHDEFMATLLGLSHLTLLAFVRAAGRGPLEASLAAADGTTYGRLAAVARGLLEDSPELLRDIQALNPDTPVVVRRLREALTDWERAAADSEGKAFVTLLEEARATLGGDTR